MSADDALNAGVAESFFQPIDIPLKSMIIFHFFKRLMIPVAQYIAACPVCILLLNIEWTSATMYDNPSSTFRMILAQRDHISSPIGLFITYFT